MPRSFLVKLRAKKNTPIIEDDIENTKGKYITPSDSKCTLQEALSLFCSRAIFHARLIMHSVTLPAVSHLTD
jgi:hypothetical protein